MSIHKFVLKNQWVKDNIVRQSDSIPKKKNKKTNKKKTIPSVVGKNSGDLTI